MQSESDSKLSSAEKEEYSFNPVVLMDIEKWNKQNFRTGLFHPKSSSCNQRLSTFPAGSSWCDQGLRQQRVSNGIQPFDEGRSSLSIHKLSTYNRYQSTFAKSNSLTPTIGKPEQATNSPEFLQLQSPPNMMMVIRRWSRNLIGFKPTSAASSPILSVKSRSIGPSREINVTNMAPLQNQARQFMLVNDEETSVLQKKTSTINAYGNLLPINRRIQIPKSFIDLLRCEDATKLFRDFLKTEHSSENLDFWLDVEGYKTNPRSEIANNIFCTYVGDKALKEVNLSHKTKKAIEDNVTFRKKDVFNDAQLEIFQLMKKDSFVRFLTNDD